MTEYELGLNDRKIATWCAIIGLIIFGIPCGIASVIFGNRAISRGVPVGWQLFVGWAEIVLCSLSFLAILAQS